jgi:DNA-binding MarR family transcriptional regulator
MSYELSASSALKLLLMLNVNSTRAGEPDLSFRQLSILLHLYLTPPPYSVTKMAEGLNVTKPVITRALDSLGKLSLIERKRDEKDKRTLAISRTLEGAAFIERLTERLQKEAADLSGHYAPLTEFDFLEPFDLERLSRAS